ncbi:OB-fold domain-containing protein [Bosea sp. BK604]|uniref:Zn-ribbon domain-containing OB-fold protein n=1 Tax=Bosea sp. BK604 TaxID=2512180 RepID=UPI001043266B|nr:OB-fold domain-containing protein [Bosea sp. BK604]TCR70641.1 hypothetical protein EV560_1011049 [Bosea sp. BK604]
MGKSNRVLGHYDGPMWESIARKQWALQYCPQSDSFRYPPSPVCPISLSLDYEWRPIKGTGEILSWAVFHRKYFDDHPPPYNTIAVRLDEGPIVISNLIGPEPEGNWIGRRVEVVYEEHEGYLLPRMRLV